MTDEMHDERVMKALAGRNPVDGEAVDAGLSAEDRSALRSRAMTLGGAVEPPRSPRWRSAWKPVAFAALLVVAAFVAITLIDGEGSGPGTEQVYAAEAIKVAEGNPRLLVGEEGWSVSYAGEFEVDQGYMDFKHDREKLSINWSDPRYYYETEIPKQGLDVWTTPHRQIDCTVPVDEGEKKGDYQPGGTLVREDGTRIPYKIVKCLTRFRATQAQLLDRDVIVGETEQTIPGKAPDYDYMISVPPSNGLFVSITAYGMSEDRFREVLDSIYATDVDTWLAALPADVVRPTDRPEIVEDLLKGLPLHPDVDVEALKGEAGALDRYQLGAKVSGAVACAWLDQWAEAVKTGDDEAKEEATEAMSDSRDWPVLEDMADEGGWSQVVWEYSKQMQEDDRKGLLGTAGTETIDGKTYELSPSYATGIGCDSEKRVLRDE